LSEAVLDASVVVKWFAAEQRGSFEARELRNDYEAGRLSVVVPALLFLELLNVAGRRWKWDEEALVELAEALGGLSFEVGEPELQLVASWLARGLTAYDAAYVALAEQRGLTLVTDDETIIALAPEVSRPLVRHPSRTRPSNGGVRTRRYEGPGDRGG
jgi:predicted nucleic acid-binding protein